MRGGNDIMHLCRLVASVEIGERSCCVPRYLLIKGLTCSQSINRTINLTPRAPDPNRWTIGNHPIRVMLSGSSRFNLPLEELLSDKDKDNATAQQWTRQYAV
jgi:hypothetical protein